MTFWSRLRSVLLRRPEPNDERTSKARQDARGNRELAALTVQSKAASQRAAAASRKAHHAHRMGLRERVAGRYSDINHYGHRQ